MEYLAGFVIFLFAWLLFLKAGLALKDRLPPAHPSLLKGGFLLFASCFLLIIALQGLAAYLLDGADDESPDLTASLFRMASIQGGICLLALVSIVFINGRQGLEGMGINAQRPWIILGYAVAAYFTFFPVYAFFCLVNHLLVGDFVPQRIVEELITRPELTGSVFVIGTAAVIIPILEEIMFRGFLYSGLREYMRPLHAVAVSALFFGFMHELHAIIPVISLGLILGYLRERTGSLLPAVAVHILHNGLMLVFIIIRP